MFVRRAPRRRPVSRFRPQLGTLEGRELLTLMGNQLFPLDNAWNQKITAAPVASNSTAIIQNIIANQGSDGRFWPDWVEYTGSTGRLYGIPFNIVHGNSTPKVPVVIDGYPAESDRVDVPIPANAKIGGDFEDRPNPDPVDRGDSHLIVYDADNNVSYELFYARRPSENADGQWHAYQLSVWDLKVNTFRTIGYNSADAAGLSILAGLARPDEALPVADGGQGVINHAIRMTLDNSIILNQFVYPASHIANPGNTDAAVMPPMGARFRLKASVDIANLYPQAKVVAQALKDYGLIVADNGSNFYASGASYVFDTDTGRTYTWNNDQIHDWTYGLKRLRFSDFEVVDLTPIVTGLSASSGAAGSTIIVNGQNFAGAAGRLSVLFGSVPGTGVTVLDDNRVQVTVPAGTGTVDVRVQSGIESGNSDNLKAPIFGYGTSAVTAAARFTIASGNQPPTVATPASASPSPVTGTTTTLSVRGADDGGEAALTYTWSVLAAPTGATPVFAANGTNAARNAVVTFNRAGSYTFRVTLTDAQGLSTTSQVSVAVNATLTRLAVSPATATVAANGSVTFSAAGRDQFGQPISQSSNVQWSVQGQGRITGSGKYTAPRSGSGTDTVIARASGVSGTATVSWSSGSTRRLGSTTPPADAIPPVWLKRLQSPAWQRWFQTNAAQVRLSRLPFGPALLERIPTA